MDSNDLVSCPRCMEQDLDPYQPYCHFCSWCLFDGMTGNRDDGVRCECGFLNETLPTPPLVCEACDNPLTEEITDG